MFVASEATFSYFYVDLMSFKKSSWLKNAQILIIFNAYN